MSAIEQSCVRDVRVVVFDVCGTLYDSNTTVDFVVYFLSRVGLRRRSITLSLLRLKVVAFVLYKLFGFDLRGECIRSLESWSRDSIESIAVEFVNSELASKKNPVIFSILQDCLVEDNVDIYLASASIDSVVKAIANSLGVKWVSSKLAFDLIGNCQGVLASDVTGSKMDVLQKIFGVSTVDSFYSDNVDDIPASLRSKKFYFVKSGILSLLRARRMRHRFLFSVIKGR